VRKFLWSALTPFVLLAALLLAGAAAAQGEDENKPLLPLPMSNGAWVMEMSRDGGMRPSRQSVSINSASEIAVRAEHYAAGAPVVDCSLKTKLSAEDFQKFKDAFRAVSPASWLDGYSDKKHPICCDQPTTRLTLRRRDSRDSMRSYSTSWYPGSSELRPRDLARVAEVAQELWNKASARCEAGEASE
jgi:hypothetical protein